MGDQKRLEICGMKFRSWQKILLFTGIKFHDLAKKLQNHKIFFPRKFQTIMYTMAYAKFIQNPFGLFIFK